ncbi:MAG TPA: HEAT repeat domain-containing protein [Planctomycetota bacterium]|nr:HEAT repeat domain-containing protein [Planctomycetota bacterium]
MFIFLAAALLQDPWTDFPRLAADPNPGRRTQAVESLRPFRNLRMAQALLPLLGDPHPRVRLRASEALRETDPTGLAFLARTGLRHPSPLVRRETCAVLAAAASADARPMLLERLADPDPSVRGAAAAALAAFPDPDAARRLEEAFRHERDWPLRAFGLETLARRDPDRAAALLEEAARDRHPHVRLVAAETAARRGSAETLAELLADPDWRVRSAAAQAAAARGEPALAGPLIERLGREKGRLRAECADALRRLTGKDLGLEPGPWKAWWEARSQTPAAPPARESRVSFFDIPVLSDRLLFLIDLSGSMREPSPGGGTKLDAARRGLLETLRALPPATRFGIVGLGCDDEGRSLDPEKKTWQGRPVLLPALPAVKADAERWLAALEARGWTDLYDGIARAFEAPDVDTIYLYSDGGASKGTFVAASDILSQVAALNRFRRIVIHAVEVPADRILPDNRRLLRRLAEDSGGTFRPAAPDPASKRR